MAPAAVSAKLTTSALADLCASIGLNPDTLACLLPSPSDNTTPAPYLMRRLPAAPFEPLTAEEITILNTVFFTSVDAAPGSIIITTLLRRFGHSTPWAQLHQVEAARSRFYKGAALGFWTKLSAFVTERADVFTGDHNRAFKAIANAERTLNIKLAARKPH